jgi:hypothetical protein
MLTLRKGKGICIVFGGAQYSSLGPIALQFCPPNFWEPHVGMSEDALSKHIHWNTRLEEYFAHTGEKAHCLSYLHKRSEENFSRLCVFIDLPVIILSTINGAVSVGSSTLFGNSNYASVGVGAVALITALLSTCSSYFSWSRRAEAHKISSIQYAKLYRFLTIEMALPRDERMTPSDLLKYCKEQYDRLSEISPLIPPGVIADFKTKFRDLKDVSFPEEANGLHPITVFSDEFVFSPVSASQQIPDLVLEPRAENVDHEK